MSAPTFDETKFYRMRVTGDQLRGLLGTLRKLDEHVKAKRSRQRWSIFLGIVATIACFWAMSALDQRVFLATVALSGIGLCFVWVTSLVRVAWKPVPGGMARGSALFLLFIPGVFVYFLGLMMWVGNSRLLSITDPRVSLIAVLVSTAVVVACLLLVASPSWTGLVPQAVELDYVDKITTPLFADLNKRTRGELVFNPFRGEWSQIALPVPSRPGFSIEASADIILKMTLPLDEERELKLSIIEQQASKTKIRKGKYKGTKRSMLVRYDMTLPEGAKLPPEAEIVQVLAQIQNQTPSRVTVAKNKLTVIQVKKTMGFDRDLKEEHFLPAEMVLGTIRIMSQAALQRS